MGLCSGRTTVEYIVKGLVQNYVDEVEKQLKLVAEDKAQLILVIFDNYVMPRWLKRMISTQQFTQQLATMSVLVRALSVPDAASPSPEEAIRAFFTAIDFTCMSEKFQAGYRLNVPACVREQYDKEYKRQSVSDF